VLILCFNGWHEPTTFQSGWFLESLLSQTLIVHVIRTGRIPFVQSWPSWPLLATTLIICAIGVWLPFSGLAHGLGLKPLPMMYLAVLPLIIIGYITLTQWAKHRLIRRFGLN
ncbi:MAG: cation transporting ATPase C-terminal domain-containing protein, partial [Gammaproteobacteria bacterium]